MARETNYQDRPGFCQKCFCERCMRGFYTAVKAAVKFRTDHWVCAEHGCSGDVRTTPMLAWKRFTPCKDGCARLKKKDERGAPSA